MSMTTPNEKNEDVNTAEKEDLLEAESFDSDAAMLTEDTDVAAVMGEADAADELAELDE